MLGNARSPHYALILHWTAWEHTSAQHDPGTWRTREAPPRRSEGDSTGSSSSRPTSRHDKRTMDVNWSDQEYGDGPPKEMCAACVSRLLLGQVTVHGAHGLSVKEPSSGRHLVGVVPGEADIGVGVPLVVVTATLGSLLGPGNRVLPSCGAGERMILLHRSPAHSSSESVVKALVRLPPAPPRST